MPTPLNTERIGKLRKRLNNRRSRYVILQNALFKIKSFDQLFVIIVAMLIGVFAGVISAGFRTLIDFFRHTLWSEGALIHVVMDAPLYLKIGIPAVGGAGVAWFVKRFAPEAKGHGVPEVMNAVATQNGFIRMRVVLVKAFASAMSIATGASVGREGPIVQIGSAFGSTIGQMFQVSIRRMKTFIGCGAAAGIAATFNAPIAGAIFASEVILGDFSAAAIGPIIIASVFGTVISRALYGDFPAFVSPTYTLHSPIEIAFYIVLGIVTGVVAWFFVRTLYKSEDLFDAWKAPVALKGLLGGALLGGVAVYFPQILGVGYETMESVLSGNLGFAIAAGLVLAKIFATSLSMGFGASGGVFAPSLFIGSMLGGAMGTIIHSLFPEITATSGAYALVGMAAMVAATTHAPVMAVLIIFEMTTEYTVILPLMITSIIDIYGGKDINVLDQISVKDLRRKILDTLPDSMTLQQLLEKMSTSSALNFYVRDDAGILNGIITHSAMRRYLNHHEKIPDDVTVQDMMNRKFEVITDETPIHEVLRKMIEMDLEAMPVVDGTGVLQGEVLRTSIVHQYQEQLIHAESAKAMASSMKFVHKTYREKSEVMPGFFLARINTPSAFVNQSLRSLNVRQTYGVDILLIRRTEGDQERDIIPEVNDNLLASDQLLVFGEQEWVERLCDAH